MQALAERVVDRAPVSDTPISVCHVMTADLWAGAEVQVAAAASYLARRPGVTVRAVLLNDGPLAARLGLLGIETTILDERRRRAPEIVGALSTVLKGRGVDIVHTHRYKDTILGCAAAKLAGVAHVVRTMHGLPEPLRGWPRARFAAYDRLDKTILTRCADRIIAVSNDMASVLARQGYPAARLTTLPNGIDLDSVRAVRPREDVRRELRVDRDALLIGTAGRLAAVKAQSTLLFAARSILRRQPHAKFVIAGDGPLRGDLMRLASELGIGAACIFPGARADIHDVVAAFDLFVLPSAHEGMPMALLEAMALRCPSVATRVGGIPEVITHGVDGLLVPAADPRSLAGACLRLAEDPGEATKLALEARHTIERRFSLRAHGAALVDVYQHVVAAGCPSLSPPPRGPRLVTTAGLARTSIAGHDPVREIVCGPKALGPLVLARELTFGVARYAARKVAATLERARERRRMYAVRKRPAPLLAALRSASHILVVCHGNIIRSPFAASLLREAVGTRRAVSIASAGLSAVEGSPAHETAIRVAGTRLVDLSAHSASTISTDAVSAHDLIFVMDVPQLIALQRRFPAAGSKTYLLACLAGEGPLEIADPIGGDASAYQTCFGWISRAVQPIAQALAATPAAHRP